MRASPRSLPIPVKLAPEGRELTIGIIQFPATLNPSIDAMAAKSYVLGAALRPFTVYDADWQLACLLCVKVPSIEDGDAVPVDLADGKKGIDITFTIRPDAFWGDGVPVTTETSHLPMPWGATRPAPSPTGNSIVGSAELPSRTTRRSPCMSTSSPSITRPSMISCCCPPISRRARFGSPRNTGCAPATIPNRPIPVSTTDHTGSAKSPRASHILLEPNPLLARLETAASARHDTGYREYRGARSQPSLRHDRHGRRRARLPSRGGGRVREASPRSVSHPL